VQFLNIEAPRSKAPGNLIQLEKDQNGSSKAGNRRAQTAAVLPILLQSGEND
jgi:hypothetical protein